ncbi:serine hydrolase [Pontibacter sp. SGAir0037]|uniref:serine hydrolase domain-containing protein n=1 Tax=Pontibacter sp. SGAir0037 TaxID=2571030 RepID=UPI0010CCF47C|nr:serine hydrolase domain-containing protein [Pontibacter sp. SGAir0037]QCR22224.1 hypothetical protein C1N53_07625 [Pontibacter sp. SGAir0037]
MKTGKLLAIFLLIFIFGCQINEASEAAIPEAISAESELLSYVFLKSNNPSLSADIAADISGPNIILTVPDHVNPEQLVATYTTRSAKSKLYVDDAEQVSSLTRNDFSSPVYYKLVTETGAAISFNVELNSYFPDLDLAARQVMQRYKIPGLSVAIVRNEKLVATKSYGYANIEQNELVKNNSKFRIASLSKPITAIAVLKLVQEGKLSLNDRVFGSRGVLQFDYGTPRPGSDIDKITVEHLLEHKSGWVNEKGDPMFMNFSSSQKELITDALLNKPLKYTPGTSYNYSNLGYCILGRIIEKVSGMPYAAYIRTEILLPSGITDMEIAGNTFEQHLPQEVKYYQNDATPYMYNISRMDANGGWVATATDLMKFMVRIDRNPSKQDFVLSSLLKRSYLGFLNWSHSGSLPGTSAMLTRLNDEFSFVVLANTRNEEQPLLVAEEINNAIKDVILQHQVWPDVDLFDNTSTTNLIQLAAQQEEVE